MLLAEMTDADFYALFKRKTEEQFDTQSIWAEYYRRNAIAARQKMIAEFKKMLDSTPDKDIFFLGEDKNNSITEENVCDTAWNIRVVKKDSLIGFKDAYYTDDKVTSLTKHFLEPFSSSENINEMKVTLTMLVVALNKEIIEDKYD